MDLCLHYRAIYIISVTFKSITCKLGIYYFRGVSRWSLIGTRFKCDSDNMIGGIIFFFFFSNNIEKISKKQCFVFGTKNYAVLWG